MYESACRLSDFLHAANKAVNNVPPCDVALLDLTQTSTEHIKKIPDIILAISWKGVKFVDAHTMVRTVVILCPHMIVRMITA